MRTSAPFRLTHRTYRSPRSCNFRTYATETTLAPSNPLSSQPLTLLPPLPLYRRLFRAHRRHLPPEERTLGDSYIKAEFRAHRSVENPVHIVGFLTEWQLYAQKLEGGNWRDGRMEEGKVEKLSEEQVGQLFELMRAVQGKGEGEE